MKHPGGRGAEGHTNMTEGEEGDSRGATAISLFSRLNSSPLDDLSSLTGAHGLLVLGDNVDILANNLSGLGVHLGEEKRKQLVQSFFPQCQFNHGTYLIYQNQKT